MKTKLFRRTLLAFSLLMTVSMTCFAEPNNAVTSNHANDEYVESTVIPNKVETFVKDKFQMLVESVRKHPDLYGLQANETNKLYLGNGFSIFEIKTKEASNIYYFPVLSKNKIAEIITVSLNKNDKISATVGKDFSGTLENAAGKSSKNDPLTIWAYKGILVAKNSKSETQLNNSPLPGSKVSKSEMSSMVKKAALNLKNAHKVNIKNSLPTAVKNITYDSKILYGKRNNNSKFLNVPIVPQRTSDGVQHGMCWAASVASIVNYVMGENVTAVDVCDKMNVGYDDGANGATACDALNSYGVSSSSVDSVIGFDSAYNYINNNKPVYMRSSCSDGAHATVINGWTKSSDGNTLTIMDPAYECYKQVYSDDGSDYYYYFGDLVMQWYATVVLN